jgi:hypothetical protein
MVRSAQQLESERSDGRSSLRELLEGTAALWDSSVVKVDKDSPVYELVTENLPAKLVSVLPDSPLLRAEGSTGRGIQTLAPWVRVFDGRESPRPTAGRYIVYLFSVDLSTVYLSLGLGVTAFTDELGQGDRFRNELRETVERYRRLLGDQLSRLEPPPLDLQARPPAE